MTAKKAPAADRRLNLSRDRVLEAAMRWPTRVVSNGSRCVGQRKT